MVLGLGLAVWFLVEPESFQQVFLQAGETVIEMVRSAAQLIEREQGGG